MLGRAVVWFYFGKVARKTSSDPVLLVVPSPRGGRYGKCHDTIHIMIRWGRYDTYHDMGTTSFFVDVCTEYDGNTENWSMILLKRPFGF